jgi:hypothetical protein
VYSYRYCVTFIFFPPYYCSLIMYYSSLLLPVTVYSFTCHFYSFIITTILLYYCYVLLFSLLVTSTITFILPASSFLPLLEIHSNSHCQFVMTVVTFKRKWKDLLRYLNSMAMRIVIILYVLASISHSYIFSVSLLFSLSSSSILLLSISL